jgi:hypothetical protein
MTDLDKISQEFSKLDIVSDIKEKLKKFMEEGSSPSTVNEEISGDEPIIIRMQATPDKQVFFTEELGGNRGNRYWHRLLDLFLPEADMLEFEAGPARFIDHDDSSIEWRWSPPALLLSSLVISDTDDYSRFRLTDPVIAFLRSQPSFTDWQAYRELPEDPALFYQGEKLLWTISHENFLWVKLTEPILEKAKDLGIAFEFIALDQQ